MLLLATMLCYAAVTESAWCEVYLARQGKNWVVWIDTGEGGEFLQEDGGSKPARFASPVAAINYLEEAGWQLVHIVPAFSQPVQGYNGITYYFKKSD